MPSATGRWIPRFAPDDPFPEKSKPSAIFRLRSFIPRYSTRGLRRIPPAGRVDSLSRIHKHRAADGDLHPLFDRYADNIAGRVPIDSVAACAEE